MKKNIITVATMLLITITASAQDILTTTSQYYMNRFSVAPAFAGHNGNHEGFIGYRTVNMGINGAAKVMRADANGDLKNNMGYGFQVISEKAGNFNNTFAALTYAYRIQLNDEMMLSMAISPAIIRSAYNLGGALTFSAQPDPVLLNEAGLSGTGFDAGFSVMFNYKELFFSVNAPRLICQDLKFQNGIINNDRIIHGAVSYAFEFGKWELEPDAEVGYALGLGELDWQGALIARYNKRAWIQMSYNSEKYAGIGLGFAASNRIAVGYQYEIGMSDLAKYSSGTHEVTIGFLIGKAKTHKEFTIFAEDGKTEDPRSDKRDNALEKKLQQEIKDREDEIRRLEELIKQAEENCKTSSSENNENPSPNNEDGASNSEPKEEYGYANNDNIDDTESPIDPKLDPRNNSEWDVPIQLYNLRFYDGTAKLMKGSEIDFDMLVKFLDNSFHKSHKLLIVCMVDKKYPANVAEKISNERAKVIENILKSKGVPMDRITIYPVGTRLSNNTTDPWTRYMNNQIVVCWPKKK